MDEKSIPLFAKNSNYYKTNPKYLLYMASLNFTIGTKWSKVLEISFPYFGKLQNNWPKCTGASSQVE